MFGTNKKQVHICVRHQVRCRFLSFRLSRSVPEGVKGLLFYFYFFSLSSRDEDDDAVEHMSEFPSNEGMVGGVFVEPEKF
jgi:hypothetical protein